MSEVLSVVIGIQARSGSRRFPKKVFAKIGSKTVLEHVIDAANSSASYLNQYSDKNKYFVSVALCVPAGDPIKEAFHNKIKIVEGPEHDVLGRYIKLLDETNADYLVRITADCPLIPSFVISSHIAKAVMNRMDYISNVDERCRTAPDGWDCEVISEELLRHANNYASHPCDREHVTTYIRSNPPEWAKVGAVVSFLDLSHLKISLDTEAEYKTISEEVAKVEKALSSAIGLFGKRNTHRL